MKKKHFRVRVKVAAVSILGFTIAPACLHAETVLATSQDDAKEVFIANADPKYKKLMMRPGTYLTADEVK